MVSGIGFEENVRARSPITMKSLGELMQVLPPDLKQEVQDFAEFLAERRKPPKQKFLRLSWAGALRDLRDQYTSLELQKKSLEWWSD
jgi:hypothetical protein